MKKLLLILFIFISSITLIGCVQGGNNNNNENENGNNNNNQITPDEDEPKVQDLTFKYTMHEIVLKENPNTEVFEEYFYFGYYPQREIYDTELLKALNLINDFNERGFIEYNDMEFAKVTVVNNHIYAEYDEKVNEDNKDQIFKSGTGYEVGATHYFLVEPLCWKVCSNKDGVLTLLTENIFDTHIYSSATETKVINDQVIYPSNYEYSDIRAWLSNEFINICFNEEEKALLLDTTLKNKANQYLIPETPKDKDTVDKVYLLSYQEVVDSKLGYGLSGIGKTYFDRMAAATDYARAKGAIRHIVQNTNSSNWMIRTSNVHDRTHIGFGGYDGYFDEKMFYLDAPNMGVRVACKIKFE